MSEKFYKGQSSKAGNKATHLKGCEEYVGVICVVAAALLVSNLGVLGKANGRRSEQDLLATWGTAKKFAPGDLWALKSKAFLSLLQKVLGFSAEGCLMVGEGGPAFLPLFQSP